MNYGVGFTCVYCIRMYMRNRFGFKSCKYFLMKTELHAVKRMMIQYHSDITHNSYSSALLK